MCGLFKNANYSDPFLTIYEQASDVCVKSGGTFVGCPHCQPGQRCECTPCDCPDGTYIDYAIGCREYVTVIDSGAYGDDALTDSINRATNQTAEEVVTPMSLCRITDDGIDPCLSNSVCFWSRECPRGAECGPITGDSLCHQTCLIDDDCPSTTPNCQEIEMARGDILETYTICMS